MMLRLGSLDAAELLQCGDDLCRPVVYFVLAEGARERLKFCPQQNRVTACRNRSATKNFNRRKAAQLFQVGLANRRLDFVESDLIFKYERKIALHGGKFRQRPVKHFTRRPRIKPVSKYFRNENVMLQLPRGRNFGCKLPELCNRFTVQ